MNREMNIAPIELKDMNEVEIPFHSRDCLYAATYNFLLNSIAVMCRFPNVYMRPSTLSDYEPNLGMDKFMKKPYVEPEWL